MILGAAWRSLIRRPLFSLVAILSMAVGIGADTTIFAVASEIFLAQVPVDAPDELMAIATRRRETGERHFVAYENWVDLRERAGSFRSLAASAPVALPWRQGDQALFFPGRMVTGEYFATLGVEAVRGRVLGPEDDRVLGGHPVAVVSQRFWRDRLGSDPEVVGRTLHLRDHPFTVVGVLGPGFEGVEVSERVEVWVPLRMHPRLSVDHGYSLFEGNRRALMLQVVGRLAPGIEAREAAAEVDGIGDRLSAEYPDDNSDRTLVAEPVTRAWVPWWMREQLTSSALLLGGMATTILLMVCANIANLLLARAAERRREIAVQLALGLGARRLVVRLLAESLLLATLGGAGGLLLAWSLRGLVRAQLARVPLPLRELDLAFDGRVFAVTALVSTLAGLGFGLVPALQVRRLDLAGALRGGGSRTTGRRRWTEPRQVLVAVQVALSVFLLVGAGLFLRNLAVVRSMDPGFERSHLVFASFDLGTAGYDPERARVFQRRLVEEAEALPGIERAVIAQAEPLRWGWYRTVNLPGEPDDERGRLIESNVVGPGYLATVGIGLETGREFHESDRGRPEVAVVNATFAAELWPGESAIGKRFRIRSSRTDYTVEVVGVARPADYTSLGEDPRPYVYLPDSLEARTDQRLVVRTRTESSAAVAEIRGLVSELEPKLALSDLETVEQVLARATWAPATISRLLTSFGLAALLLTGLGVYGITSVAVAARRRELGIRMAIGADRAAIGRMILTRTLVLVGSGGLVGLVAASGAVQAIASLLFVRPLDPVVLGGTAGMFVLAALVAAALPARRAMAVEPSEILRTE